MLFPVYAKLKGSEVEFVKGIPEGVGFMLGDGVFDAKPVLNTITSKSYTPIVKKSFRDRIKMKKKESTETRILLRITTYCLKTIVRWIYG